MRLTLTHQGEIPLLPATSLSLHSNLHSFVCHLFPLHFTGVFSAQDDREAGWWPRSIGWSSLTPTDWSQECTGAGKGREEARPGCPGRLWSLYPLEIRNIRLDMVLGNLLKVAQLEQRGGPDYFQRSLPTSAICVKNERKKGGREGRRGKRGKIGKRGKRGKRLLLAAKGSRRAQQWQWGTSHLWTEEHLTCSASQVQIKTVMKGWYGDVPPGSSSSLAAEPPHLLSSSSSPCRHFCYSPVTFTPLFHHQLFILQEPWPSPRHWRPKTLSTRHCLPVCTWA